MPYVEPPAWTPHELEGYRRLLLGEFRDARRNEEPALFADVYERMEARVRHALAVTDDCRDITGEHFVRERELWHVMRYFCAPPVSEEDLWTLVGHKFKRVRPEFADATAQAISDVLDPVRFPWVPAGRPATAGERGAAVLATAQLAAAERFRTERRGVASREQEDFVAGAIQNAGFELVEDATEIALIDDMPRGTFSRERLLRGAKCDLPVRLRDGRILALECKVSNGPKNGYKRLNREVGGKAATWNRTMGDTVVTGCVLAGVFDLRCLATGQARGVSLFWQQDLTALLDFLAQATRR